MRKDPRGSRLNILSIPSQLLPQGITQIKITDHKQLDTILLYLKQGKQLGVICFDAIGNHQIGSVVSIIDFSRGTDGFITFTFQAIKRFSIQRITHSVCNNIITANVYMLENWEAKEDCEFIPELANKLSDIFNSYPQINKLYEKKYYHDISWLCQRWLEILPMPIEIKQELISHNNHDKALQHLTAIMKV